MAKGCSRNKLSMRNNDKHSKNDKVTQRLNLLKYLKAVSMKLLTSIHPNGGFTSGGGLSFLNLYGISIVGTATLIKD